MRRDRVNRAEGPAALRFARRPATLGLGEIAAVGWRGMGFSVLGDCCCRQEGGDRRLRLPKVSGQVTKKFFPSLLRRRSPSLQSLDGGAFFSSDEPGVVAVSSRAWIDPLRGNRAARVAPFADFVLLVLGQINTSRLITPERPSVQMRAWAILHPSHHQAVYRSDR